MNKKLKIIGAILIIVSLILLVTFTTKYIGEKNNKTKCEIRNKVKFCLIDEAKQKLNSNTNLNKLFLPIINNNNGVK